MGDSITAAALADWSGPAILAPTDQPYENKATLSWASGANIRSHWMRLKAAEGASTDVEVLNVARSGGVVSEMEGQAQMILDRLAKGGIESLDYVTLFIGANDACSGESEVGTPPDKFRASMAKAFAKLATIQQKEKIRILVSSIPAIPDLGRDEILNARNRLGMTCDMVHRNVYKACPKLIYWKSKGPDGYSRAMDSVISINQAIADSVKDAQRAHPNLDIALSSSVAKVRLVKEILAIDCFHPNRIGQEQISAVLWQDQPWFK